MATTKEGREPLLEEHVHVDRRMLFGGKCPSGNFDRANFLLRLFRDLRRGNQFLVSLHEQVVVDPLGTVFVSPLNAAVPVSPSSL